MFKSILPLSFIIGTRFFGLFIILPVISVYASTLKGSTPLLIGFLMGVYALTQIFLQVPFGILSDKIGRKKTLAFGLLIFILGSFLCATSSDIYTMIFGRFLQGAGAIGAVAIALVADLSSEENRSKAMAIMGGFIALAFASSMILSPILSAKFGLQSLFYLSLILSILCLFLLLLIPHEVKIPHSQDKTPIKKLLKDKNLALLNLSNFLQKMLLNTVFLSIPIILVKFLHLPSENLYKVYAFATVAGFFAMGFSGSMGAKRGLSKGLLITGVLFFLAAFLTFILAKSILVFSVGVVLFFIGFNLHEPIMQALASKFVKRHEKGKALGLFNSFGYMGSFVGAMVAGYALKHSFSMLGEFCVVLCLAWLFSLRLLKNPSDFKIIDLNLKANLNELGKIKGVFECFYTQDGTSVKFDSLLVNEEELLRQISLKSTNETKLPSGK